MKNQIIRAKCIDVTVDFYGVCKHEGLVIFVKGLLPEEEADIKIINLKKNIAYGIIDNLIIKSKHRVKEMCPIAYKCGGCDIEHADYDYQLLLKKNLIINTFKNMKLDVSVNDVIGSNKHIEYRNKMMVPVADGGIGFYRNHSNDIVEFDNCYIETEKSNIIIKEIKDLLKKFNLFNIVRHIVVRTNGDLSQYMVCLVVSEEDVKLSKLANELHNKYSFIKSILYNINNKDTNVILGEKTVTLYGDDYISDLSLGKTFRIPLKSFYQVNNEQMLKLYQKIVEAGSLCKDDRVLDLFCGIGTISLFVSDYVKDVLGVEIVEDSIEFAKINKSLNDIDNVDFILGDANSIDNYLKGFNTIIVDPPRKGISSKLVNSIINSDIKKIIYVSCNPATLARDLSLLEPFFSFSSITPIDMFPNTKHIECIVALQRK